ncbi:MAG: M1 family peptidase [Candidatus Microsaccharimonas sossegonensis]|uniref:Aminopeptidase n=1 Tax=Candidatus Microsaccharimonas sossegonensis TaxID=2506948 RepID=A0A4Q0AI25_9BACT|nr:MAG: M1 family peptidase [Candidatus Microsaccharimonas sossegonensis]
MQTVARLINTFVPKHYQLSITLDRINRTFDGTVTINGASVVGAKNIVLHSKDLAISSVTFDGKQADFMLNNNDQALTITHSDMTDGTHIVTIGFSGEITDGMHGLYPCYYEHDGVKKELLATQFESHHAREVFPCIDEPEAKATFDVTITTEQNVVVLGNMPIKNQRHEDGMLVTQFETTPRMSSYLLAWVVGELQKKSTKTASGVEVNIYATPAQTPESLDFALDIATRGIEFFDAYFDVPYPLPKSDHVALPDFSSGAMENWGLITYREIALLNDPKTGSLQTRQQAALTITHELSHQWFGNLVTMKWWNDLWLNESFANMMEYVCVDALEPQWHIWLDQVTYEVVQALRRDSLDGVQAIRTEVNHPDEISTIFDPSIVYAKGGRLLRMLQSYIGDAVLQTGLKTYFKKFAYQNTDANDLWECLSEASGQDIGLLMNSWISQSGYPVLNVSQDGDLVHLSQEQFFIGPHEPSEKIWPIPLGASEQNFPRLMTEKELTLTRSSELPLVMNHESTAHFITHYTPSLLAELVRALPTLSDTDRLKLLNEQVLLAQASRLSSAELIPLLWQYKNESVEAVWDIMLVALNELKKFVETDEILENKLRAFAANLAEEQFQRLGWDPKKGETEADTKLRSIVVGLMLYSERADILEKARNIYDSTTLEAIDPNLRVIIIGSVVRYAKDQSIINHLLKAHQMTSSSELKEDIASAITSTRDPESIDRLLGLLKDATIVRPQDFMRWFVWLLRNRHARNETWRWGRDNWSWMEETFGGDKSYDSFPRYVAMCLITAKQLEEYKQFFDPLKKQVALKRNIELGMLELSSKIAHIARDQAAVRNALLEL